MKIKIILSLIWLSLQQLVSFGQTTDLIPFKIDSLWGYCDKNKNIIIQPKYDRADLFNNGFAVVKLNWKYSLINRKGVEQLPFIYERIEALENGLIQVSKACLKGFIDLSGKEIIPIIYDDAVYYRKHIICQKGGSIYFFNNKGKIIKQFEYDATYKDGYLWLPRVEAMGNTLYRGILPVMKNHKYGDLKFDGNEIVPTIFDEVSDPIHYIQVKLNNKYGIYDFNGKIMLKPEYDEIEYFGGTGSSNVRVRKNGKWGVVDTLDKLIIPFIYDRLDKQFIESQKYIYVGITGDKGDVIDTNGNIVTSFKYNSSTCRFGTDFILYPQILSNGYYVGKICEKMGILTSDFKPFVPFIYDELSAPYNGYIRVKKENKYGYLDKKGNVIIPCKYEQLGDIRYSSNGLIPVHKKNKLIGYVNLSGTEYFTEEN